jgi:enoyl-CoA hydratase
MTDSPLVSVERTGPLAIVTVQRPEKLNALNARVIGELLRAFVDLDGGQQGESIRAAVLTGAGKAFIAGADIAEMATMTTPDAKRFSDLGQRLCALIETVSFPVIAAVNGFALGGGCEIALACDFIYAAEGAKLGQPEVTLGVTPGFGGTQRLLRRVGIARARELVYTGDMISAQQALDMGLVNAVVPAGELMLRARDIALKIAARGPLAVSAAKRIMLRGEGVDLVNACELEAQTFSSLFGTEDQKAGMRAFLDKSKPAFTGR